MLTALIIPTDVLLIQNYFTVAGMHLLNTYLGMMVVFFVLPMNIYIMRQNLCLTQGFKRGSHDRRLRKFSVLFNILLPSSKPIITTVFILQLCGNVEYVSLLCVASWLPMWMRLENGAGGNNDANTVDSSPYGTGAMAASVIILIPSVLIFVLFQRRVVGGIMAGSVKG